ncbi:MAG: hypothetical protein H6Q70_2133 [Firmicutes bacterium]|nr:hypothetical protein [Bacillota bacterium]
MRPFCFYVIIILINEGRVKNMFTLQNNNFGIKAKLILAFATILLIPSLCIGWFSYKTAYNKVEENMLESANESVVMLDHMLNQIITNTQKNVDFIAGRIALGGVGAVQGDEDPFARAMLDAYRATHTDVELAAVGTDKGVYINSPVTAVNAPGYDPRKRPWYINALENKGKPTVINPYISSNSGQVVVTVSQTVGDGHGIVSISLSLQELAKIANGIKVGKEGYVYILDKNSNVLVHPTLKPGSKAEGPVFEEMMKQKQGIMRYESEGQKRLAFLITNEQTGWLIGSTMPESEIIAAARPILITTLGIVLLFIVIGSVIIYFVTLSITKPLQVLVDASEQISNGDLRVDIPITSQDEFGKLSISFNKMSNSLRKFLQQMRQTGEQLSASSEQLSASAHESAQASTQVAGSISDVAHSVELQLNAINDTASTIQDMSKSIEQAATTTKQVFKQSADATEKAADGGKAIDKAVNQMTQIEQTVTVSAQVVAKLGDRSKEIGQIVDTISGIAGQTNLLALNAAIEAARAGEQGRGFAVVADEVRKLAEQSQEAAKQIAALINEIQKDTDKAVITMNDGTREVKMGAEIVDIAGKAFKEIVVLVTEVSERVREFATSTNQMTDGSQQIVTAINKIDEMSKKVAGESQMVSAATEEQSASMEEIASASQLLLQAAQGLQNEVSKFKL